MSEGQEHRFLGSGVEEPRSEFSALSRSGSGAYEGLEVFDNPGCGFVTYSTDEVVLKCPVTGQPDYYVCEIGLADSTKLIESKSLKIFFNTLHEESMRHEGGLGGMFCEAFAVFLRREIASVTETPEEQIRVTLTQKSRGGVSIKAVA